MNNVLTVLVAGHRPDRLPAGEHLFSVLENLLTLLRGVASGQHATLRVLTGVAEGTDEETAIIAERLELPLHLLAPGQPEPLASSQQRAERVVWLGASDENLRSEESIAIRDEVALSFADILVAVWDGESPQGLSGGTVRLAFQAALMMKPVVWLKTDGSVHMLDRTRLIAPYLHKLRCPHPEPQWLQDCFTPLPDEAAQQQSLTEAVHMLVDPPAPSSKDEARRLDGYRAESGQRNDPIRAGHFHEAMMALVRSDFARLRKQLKAKVPEPYFGPEQAEEGHPIAPTPLIDARFRHYDVEANVSAGRHRDSTWLMYGASAMAVFAAVAGVIGLWPGGHGVFWLVAELVLIAMIVGSVVLSKNKSWHFDWVCYRFIAEQLRYAKMCLPLLGVPRPFMEPAWRVKDGSLHLASAELWLMQRTLITEGLPVGANGKAYAASTEEIKARLAQYVHDVIESQKKYHHDKHEELHAAHKRMHWLSMGLFGATALAVLAHFAIHANWLLICTAFFPALAAAIHGVSTKLEITRLADQHDATGHELDTLVDAINDAGRQPGWDGWIRLRHLSLEAARIMSDENGQWQQLIRHQETELPA